jgi:hypothetical protein
VHAPNLFFRNTLRSQSQTLPGATASLVDPTNLQSHALAQHANAPRIRNAVARTGCAHSLNLRSLLTETYGWMVEAFCFC